VDPERAMKENIFLSFIIRTFLQICTMIKVRAMRWDRYVALVEEMKNENKILLVGKPEGRPRHELKDNTKVDLKEIWCVGVD